MSAEVKRRVRDLELSLDPSNLADIRLLIAGKPVSLTLCQRLVLEVLPDGLPVLTLSFVAPGLQIELTEATVIVETPEDGEAEPEPEDSAKPLLADLPQNRLQLSPAGALFARHLPEHNPEQVPLSPGKFIPALQIRQETPSSS